MIFYISARNAGLQLSCVLSLGFQLIVFLILMTCARCRCLVFLVMCEQESVLWVRHGEIPKLLCWQDEGDYCTNNEETPVRFSLKILQVSFSAGIRSISRIITWSAETKMQNSHPQKLNPGQSNLKIYLASNYSVAQSAWQWRSYLSKTGSKLDRSQKKIFLCLLWCPISFLGLTPLHLGVKTVISSCAS